MYEVLIKHEKLSSLHFNETKVNNDVKHLYQKCNEFEELKQNVKELNEAFKNELFLSISAIEVMLREKIDIFSNSLKEGLKVSYKTMNEKQTSILKEIKVIDEECQQKKKEMRLSNQTIEEIDKQISELFDLKIDKVYDDLNKCDTRLLYPNIKLNLNLQPLVDAVNGLKIEKIEIERIDLNISSLEKRLNKSLTLIKMLLLSA